MQRVSALLLILLLSGILTACASPYTAATAATSTALGPIKVGAIFDLTGPTADVGRPYAAGVNAYVNYFNAIGGANGRQIELIDNDYAYKPENAERLYSDYVNQDRVKAIVGWGTADTQALKDRVNKDKLPLVSGSLSEALADVNTAPYNFVIGVTYSDQMRIALQYILQQNNNVPGIKVAFMYNDSPFGRSPEGALDDVAAANQIKVLKVAMPRGALDLTGQMQEVNDFGPDYVIIQNTAVPAALALRNGAAVGVESQFIMLNFAANEVLINQAQELAEGVIGVMPFAVPTEDLAATKTINEYLKSRNQGTLDDADKGVTYSQGWTIMSVLAEGIKRAAAKGEVTGDSIKAGLEELQNFDTGGITTPITFGPHDHVGASALRLYQVIDGRWQPITDFIEAEK